jgi:Zn-dependent peptidase ImmA (M78 family)
MKKKMKMNRIKYNSPRLGYIKNIVSDLYIKFKIDSYPIDVKKLFRKIPNARIVPFSKFMKKYNISLYEVYTYLNTDEGCTIYDPKTNRYIVYYNDIKFKFIYIKTPERQRWTLAHELGHILLKHHTITNKTKIFRNTLTDKEYNWMEREANYFASLLLAYPLILYKLRIKNSTDIASICGISQEAASYRFEDYKKWSLNKKIDKKDLLILEYFNDFLSKKHCPTCGYDTKLLDYGYCPICGAKLERGSGNMIYNDGYELDKNGRAVICPVCGNEEIGEDPDEQYCIICGTYLVNKCTHDYDEFNNFTGEIIKPACGKIVPGNARYCPYCGSETTFFRNGLLQPWQEAKEELEKIPTADIDDLPF